MKLISLSLYELTSGSVSWQSSSDRFGNTPKLAFLQCARPNLSGWAVFFFTKIAYISTNSLVEELKFSQMFYEILT